MTDAPSVSNPLNSDRAPTAGPAVDLSKAQTIYVNFCRVTGTAEELIIDFAHQMGPASDGDPPLVAGQRITLGPMTAKRLLQVLQLTLQHHETSFGTVETTVERRLFGPPA